MSQAESHAGPSTAQTQEPTPIVWNQLPSIKILRPPQGRYSTKTDERCFTYCTQSIHGRLSQAEPWCRTFCIRKVFNHEVKRALAVYEQDPLTHHRNLNTVEVDAKYPLPPEGQRAAHFLSSLNRSSSASSSRIADAQWHSVTGPSTPMEEVRYWKEGWYLWMSQSRWAAQEKMDLMMCDLEKQADWQKYKEKVLAEWTAYEQGQLHGGGGPRGIGDSAMEDHRHGTNPTLAAQHDTPIGQDHGHDPLGSSGPTQPFPDSGSHSLLVELPPPLPPLTPALRSFFLPSLRLLESTRQSIASGDQTRFAKTVWGKVITKEPYEMVDKVLRHTWNFWTQPDQDEKDKKGS